MLVAMRIRGDAGSLWLLAVLLAGTLFAGVTVVGRAADTTTGQKRDSSEAVPSGDEEAPRDAPAGQEPSADATSQEPSADPTSQDPSADPADHSATEPDPAAASAPAEGEAETPSPAPPDHPEVVIPYRVQVRTGDPGAADFPAVVHDVLTDPRGWVRAGFRFVRDAGAAYTIVIGEGEEVDRLCRPYDTAGAYSCQNGPVVAINADRWRGATPEWPGNLGGYRTMLINHEVGHLLHLHHPDPQCPGAGLPSPVMAQQSSGPDPCLPQSWPLQWEIDRAAQRREPLAPPSGHDVTDHRPTPPAASS